MSGSELTYGSPTDVADYLMQKDNLSADELASALINALTRIASLESRASAPSPAPRSTMELATVAAREFGGPTHGLFNTAGFQVAWERVHVRNLVSSEADRLLGDEPRIVRLSGGCHWLILPEDFTRFAEVDGDEMF